MTDPTQVELQELFAQAHKAEASERAQLSGEDVYEPVVDVESFIKAKPEVAPEVVPEIKQEQAEKDWQAEAGRLAIENKRQLNLNAGVQRRLAEIERQNNEYKAVQEQARLQQDVSRSNPKIDGFRADYPDISDSVEEIVRQVRAETKYEIEQLKASIAPIQQNEQAKAVETNLHALSERHPDWQTIEQQPEFNQWFGEQPGEIQTLLQKGQVNGISRVLDFYKAEHAPQRASAPDPRTTSAKDRLRQAAGIPSRPAPVPTNEETDDAALFKAAHRAALTSYQI